MIHGEPTNLQTKLARGREWKLSQEDRRNIQNREQQSAPMVHHCWIETVVSQSRICTITLGHGRTRIGRNGDGAAANPPRPLNISPSSFARQRVRIKKWTNAKVRVGVQFSGDESRRLFTSGAKVPESTMENRNLGVITYGSVVFQLKDANLEADNICDFVFRGLKVVCRTKVVTVCLVCLTMIPVLMLIYGWNFWKDCPAESMITLYMVIGGTFGTMLMVLLIYSQIRSRRPNMLTVPSTRPQISFMKLIIFILSCFLMVWFVMGKSKKNQGQTVIAITAGAELWRFLVADIGNYWILHIMWPPYNFVVHTPNDHCNKTLYEFSLVHLGVIYITLGITLLVITVLASFRILACPLPESVIQGHLLKTVAKWNQDYFERGDSVSNDQAIRKCAPTDNNNGPSSCNAKGVHFVFMSCDAESEVNSDDQAQLKSRRLIMSENRSIWQIASKYEGKDAAVKETPPPTTSTFPSAASTKKNPFLEN
ncbi:hypothetical protein WN48_00480 [Eufriesea mexicana]|nr:hypothetical protein WN48_00480 [Eufriesea mexicana]